jgi:phosphoesterase RecJ-like protein
MSETMDIAAAARQLLSADNILLLCHKNPDGDTLGSAGGLCRALRAMDKACAVFCADPVHERYAYMGLEMFRGQFAPAFIVALDIAGQQLFGEAASEYKDNVDLCIDQHSTNSGYAAAMLLCPDAAATSEVVFDLVLERGAPIDGPIANCLYTGVSTDTGCFRYTNTTARTHRIAADLIGLGADLPTLNELLFENKSKSQLAIEQLALMSLEYHLGDACALISFTRDQISEIGADETDLEGISSLPRAIDGVRVGITMRQQRGGSYKISVRTKAGISAASICEGLGGGGHAQAAGCEVIGSLDNAKAAILAETQKALARFCP